MAAGCSISTTTSSTFYSACVAAAIEASTASRTNQGRVEAFSTFETVHTDTVEAISTNKTISTDAVESFTIFSTGKFIF
jgi:hypothetical protein